MICLMDKVHFNVLVVRNIRVCGRMVREMALGVRHTAMVTATMDSGVKIFQMVKEHGQFKAVSYLQEPGITHILSG